MTILFDSGEPIGCTLDLVTLARSEWWSIDKSPIMKGICVWPTAQVVSGTQDRNYDHWLGGTNACTSKSPGQSVLS